MSSFHIILNLLYCCLPLEVYPLRSPTWYLSREVGWPPSLPTGPFPQWAPFLPSFCQELAGRNDHCRRPNSIPWSHGNMAATMTSSYLISFCIYFFYVFSNHFVDLKGQGFSLAAQISLLPHRQVFPSERNILCRSSRIEAEKYSTEAFIS